MRRRGRGPPGTGGVSVGDYDLVKQGLQQCGGHVVDAVVTEVFERVQRDTLAGTGQSANDYQALVVGHGWPYAIPDLPGWLSDFAARFAARS